MVYHISCGYATFIYLYPLHVRVNSHVNNAFIITDIITYFLVNLFCRWEAKNFEGGDIRLKRILYW